MFTCVDQLHIPDAANKAQKQYVVMNAYVIEVEIHSHENRIIHFTSGWIDRSSKLVILRSVSTNGRLSCFLIGKKHKAPILASSSGQTTPQTSSEMLAEDPLGWSLNGPRGAP
jgi:hypothetical protein